MTVSANRFLLLFVLLALGACAGQNERPTDTVASSTPGLTVVHRREVHDLTQSVKTVVIRNRHGDVRVRSAPRQSVGLFAVIQKIGARPPSVELLTSQDGEAFTVTVHYPGEVQWAEGDHSRGRVDLAVWLPKGVRIELETMDGKAQIKRATGAVRVRTTSGRIEVSTRGDLDVETVSGSILARQESGEWNGVARVVSRSGRILAAVPVFADVHLTAQAGGVLSVDPGLPTAQPSAAGGMVLDARFGAATRTLELSTGGDLHIVPVIRLPKRADDSPQHIP